MKCQSNSNMLTTATNGPRPAETIITKYYIEWQPLKAPLVRHVIAVSPMIWFLAVIFRRDLGDLSLTASWDAVYRPYRAFAWKSSSISSEREEKGVHKVQYISVVFDLRTTWAACFSVKFVVVSTQTSDLITPPSIEGIKPEAIESRV